MRYICSGIIVAIACALVGAAPSHAQVSGPGIIDAHAHLAVDPRLRFDRALATAITDMNRFGIAVSILMSPPRPRRFRNVYDSPDFKSALARYPGRFVFLGGGGTLNLTLHRFDNPARVTRRVRQRFAAQAKRLLAGGAKGFGEISSFHISLSPRHGYSHVPADHPLLRILSDIAAGRGVPIDFHMDALVTASRPPPHLAKLSNNPKTFPATLPAFERLLAYNRRVKIVWAHGGTDHLGDFSPAVIRRLMDKHPNLFMSLKITGRRARTMNKVIARGQLHPAWLSLFRRHPHRFVIGTDSFYDDPEVRGPWRGFARRRPFRLKATAKFMSLLPRDLARKIGRENAIRLYRLNISGMVPRGRRGASTGQGTAPRRRLCREGNMDHCRRACRRGFKGACRRLKRGR